MSDPAEDVLKPSCGNCKHGKPADAAHVACFGGPPSVVLMGQRPGRLAGQVELRFENMRPILANEEPPCAKWERRIIVDLSGLNTKRTN